MYLVLLIKIGSYSVHLTALCFSHETINIRNNPVSSERVNVFSNLYLISNGSIIYLSNFLLMSVVCFSSLYGHIHFLGKSAMVAILQRVDIGFEN